MNFHFFVACVEMGGSAHSVILNFVQMNILKGNCDDTVIDHAVFS